MRLDEAPDLALLHPALAGDAPDLKLSGRSGIGGLLPDALLVAEPPNGADEEGVLMILERPWIAGCEEITS